MGGSSESDILETLQGKDMQEYLKWCQGSYRDPDKQEWSASIMRGLSVVSESSSNAAGYPQATFRLTISPLMANALGNCHGGCTSTIFDICTSISLHLISRPGFWQYSGVSRTLNVTYIRPVPVGTTVDIECEIVHVGRRLCSLRGTLRSATSDGTKGPVLATCEHGKVTTDPPVEKL